MKGIFFVHGHGSKAFPKLGVSAPLKPAWLDGRDFKGRKMAGHEKATSAARVAKHRANEKLDEQIAELESQLALIPGNKKFKSHQYKTLVTLWNQRQPEAQASTEKFGSNIISTADKALNQNWSSGGQGFADDRGNVEGLRSIGTINGSPADQGPRFNCPSWVSDRKQLDEFERRLIQHRAERRPTARVEHNEIIIDQEELDQIKIEASMDCFMLSRYFVEHRDLNEFFLETPKIDKRKSEPKNKSKHFLDHIQKLVNLGYRLLELPKPTEADRELARQEREAEQARTMECSQYGRGQDPDQFLKTGKRERSQDSILALELKKTQDAEHRAKRQSQLEASSAAAKPKRRSRPQPAAQTFTQPEPVTLRVDRPAPRHLWVPPQGISHELVRLGILANLAKVISAPSAVAA
jgi:hypothetical protein